MKAKLPKVGLPGKGKSKSMKVGTKIMAVVGLCLALLALVAVSGVWQMFKIGQEIEAIAKRDMPMTEALTKVTVHQLEQAVSLERAVRTGEEMHTHPEAKPAFEKAVAKFEKLSVKVDKEIVDVQKLAKQAVAGAKTPSQGTGEPASR